MSGGVAKQAIDTTVRDEKKALGAFYTDAQIARFLVWWAVRLPARLGCPVIRSTKAFQFSFLRYRVHIRSTSVYMI